MSAYFNYFGRSAPVVLDGCRMRIKSLRAAFFGVLSASVLCVPNVFSASLGNEVACRVGVDAVSKREVERRMGDGLRRLRMECEDLVQRGRFDEAEKRMTDNYGNLFRDALRELVREKLIFQALRDAETQMLFKVNEEALRERTEGHWKALRFLCREIPRNASDAEVEQIRTARDIYGPLRPTWALLERMGRDNPHGISREDLREAVREQMRAQSFLSQFQLPASRPEVETYYRERQNEHRRPEGLMLRLIQLNFYKKDETSRLGWSPMGDPDELRRRIETWRKWIVESNEPFAKIAEKYSTDPETAARGGLLLGKDKEPYVTAEDCPSAIYAVARTLPEGWPPSEVFEISGSGASGRFYSCYAFIMVEKRRAEGLEPLEGKLFAKIQEQLNREKNRQAEEEWFKRTLKGKLVVDNNGRTLPLQFFFPDEPNERDDKAGTPQGASAQVKKP